MAIPDSFLDDLRARVPISDVVGRHIELKKRGSEWEGFSPFNAEKTESFKVNDNKGFWKDFSSGKGGNDHFSFLMEAKGLSFPQAVEAVAEIAGISLPDQQAARSRPAAGSANGRHGEHSDRHHGRGDADVEGRAAGGGRGDKTDRQIVATYDYTDPQGSLIYQVCRLEWINANGARCKTFLQRRPGPTEGSWIWGLDAGDYLRGRNGDWYQATKERVEKWKTAERRTFPDGAEHTLYRVVELREAEIDAPVFLPEGEKDVETFKAWGLVATTNSGGAKHWRPEFAEAFRGRNVVIPVDNDNPGRERGELIAAALWGIAASVRILDFATIWPGAPKGADTTDWKVQREGSAEELMEFVNALPAWTPTPRESKFGLVMWADQDAPGEEYEYLIEDLIPEREPVLIVGESQSGKSFATMDMAMAGAIGRPFFGRRVLQPFGVVYCAYEAGKGFRNRLKAYRSYHGLGLDDLPFAVLTNPIELWSKPEHTLALIDEIKWIAETKFRGVRLGAVVIDTHNAATPGASEVDSKEVSLIRDRYKAIMAATGAGVWIIGHKNAAGKHRGNEQLYNNIETAIDISRKVETVDKQAVPIRDRNGRQIRVAKVIKQREGIDGESWEFVLGTVEVGMNRYGRPRTSCIIVPPTESDEIPASNAVKLRDQQKTILLALRDAITDHGEPPPQLMRLPYSIKQVVRLKHWYDAYRKVTAEEKDTTIRTRMARASDQFLNMRIIGRENPFVWLTGRPVAGVIGDQGSKTHQTENEAPLSADVTDYF